MERFSRLQRSCLAALLVVAMLFVGLFVYYIVASRGRPTLIAQPGGRLPLVGTWLAGEHGTVLDFRSEGTGRSRLVDDPTSEIQYFEWNVAKGILVVEMAAETGEYLRRIKQSIFGTNTLHYDIVSMSPTEVHLLNRESGTTVIFTTTSDEALESAP